MTGEIADIESINHSVDEILAIARAQPKEARFDYGIDGETDVRHETCRVPFQLSQYGFDQLARGNTDKSALFVHKLYVDDTDGLVLRRAVELYIASSSRPGRELTISQKDELFYKHKLAESSLLGDEFKRLQPLAVGVAGLIRARPLYAARYAERVARVADACKSLTTT